MASSICMNGLRVESKVAMLCPCTVRIHGPLLMEIIDTVDLCHRRMPSRQPRLEGRYQGDTKKPPEGGFPDEATASELRAGGLDGLGNIELLEVFDELASQLLGRLVVGARVGPGVARIEQLGIDAGHRG